MIEEEQIENEGVFTTVQDLVDQYDRLQFFDKELKPVESELLYKANYDQELLVAMIAETNFANRMATIMRNENWVKQHEFRSEWKRNQYRNKIVNPKTETDKFGNIPHWGMKMSEAEFDTYQAAHDIIFETQDIIVG